MMRRLSALAIAFWLCAGSAHAANLVQNSGFETGDLTGYTLVGRSTGVTDIPDYVHTGTYGLYFGSIGSDDFLSQTLNTVAGQNYTISFYADNVTGERVNDLAVFFGGVLVADNVGFNTGGFARFSYTAMATSNSTTLTFGLRSDRGTAALDDISVIGPVGTVPLPSSAPMFGAALLALGAYGYRATRRRKTA